MAYEIPGRKLTLQAAADLSALQYTFVKVDANGNAAAAGDGDNAIGILQNKPTANQSAEIMVSGTSKCVFSASLAPATKIASDGTGKAQATATGKHTTGIVLEDGGASGQLGTVQLLLQGKEP